MSTTNVYEKLVRNLKIDRFLEKDRHVCDSGVTCTYCRQFVYLSPSGIDLYSSRELMEMLHTTSKGCVIFKMMKAREADKQPRKARLRPSSE